MHVACRWEDDVESNTTKDSVETGKEKSTGLRLKEKLISTWRRVWEYSQLTHPLRIMVVNIFNLNLNNQLSCELMVKVVSPYIKINFLQKFLLE